MPDPTKSPEVRIDRRPSRVWPLVLLALLLLLLVGLGLRSCDPHHGERPIASVMKVPSSPAVASHEGPVAAVAVVASTLPTAPVAPPKSPKGMAAQRIPKGEPVLRIPPRQSSPTSPVVSAVPVSPVQGDVVVLPPPTATWLVADEAPPFMARTLDGELVSLKALRGHPVVLSFFMIGCSLCWEEVPALEQLKAAHAHDGTVFLAITREPAEEARVAFSRSPLPFPVIADPDSRISSRFPVSGWPTNVVLDAQGRYFEHTVVHGSPKGLEAALQFVNSKPSVGVVRPPVRTDGQCRLAGTVRNSRSQAPEAEVDLTFWGQAPPEGTLAKLIFRTTTDATGRFELRNVACGPYNVMVHRHGLTNRYVDVEATVDGTSAIEVRGLGVIEGVVRDEHGAPVSNATVSLCDDQYGGGTTHSDASGRFSLAGLQARPLAVRVLVGDQLMGLVQNVDVTDERPTETQWVMRPAVVKGQVRKPAAGLSIRVSTRDVHCTAGATNGRSTAAVRMTDVPLDRRGAFELKLAGNTAYELALLDPTGQPMSTQRVHTAADGSMTSVVFEWSP